MNEADPQACIGALVWRDASDSKTEAAAHSKAKGGGALLGSREEVTQIVRGLSA